MQNVKKIASANNDKKKYYAFMYIKRSSSVSRFQNWIKLNPN